MAARIKVDEDLSEDVAALLRSAGYDAVSVREQQWVGRIDDRLWKDVQSEGRLLMTADKGFGQLMRSTATHHGLALLRPDREGRVEFLRLTQMLIDARVMENAENKVIVAMPDRIRMRTAKE